MKTERVTLLTTPEFKAFLTKRASDEGISVGELIRQRFDASRATDEEVALAALAVELRRAVASARRSLAEGLSDVQAALRSSGRSVAPARNARPGRAAGKRKVAA